MQQLYKRAGTCNMSAHHLRQCQSNTFDSCCWRSYAEDSTDSPPSTSASEPAEEDEQGTQGRRRLHGGRRLRRKEKGSWNDSNFVQQAGQAAPIWPANVPIYDLQTQAPFLFEKFNPVFEAYKKLREEEPEEFAKLLKGQTPELPPPREGASKILQWEVNVVFDMNPDTNEPHPLNKKVKCRVYLRDLQQEFNLSEDALQCIAQICGPRYCPNTGLLTLTSEKYRDREENRLHIVDMLNELVNEGQKMFPSETFKKSIDLRAALSEAQRVEEQSELEAVAQ